MNPKVALAGISALALLAFSSQASAGSLGPQAPGPRPPGPTPPRPTGGGAKLGGTPEPDARLTALIERARELGARFRVIETVRSVEDQIKAIEKGASSWSSAPEEAPHVLGRAVDIWAEDDAKVNDGPTYMTLARYFAKAAEELGLKVRWGGAWEPLSTADDPENQQHRYVRWKMGRGEKPFVDIGHFELVG